MAAFWDVLRFLSAFVLVVLLAYAAARLAGRRIMASGTGRLRVEGTLSLGGNRGVYLLRVGERVLLIGVAQEVTVLAEFSPDAFPEGEVLPPAELFPGLAGLATSLQEWLAAWKDSDGKDKLERRLQALKDAVRRMRGTGR